MIKDYNFHYVFVFYDVKEKSVSKVFKVCKKYLTHHQRSVFRGTITPAKLILLQEELKKVIDTSCDQITFIKLMSEKNFVEDYMGKVTTSSSDLFL